jgi:hypothetical protein
MDVLYQAVGERLHFGKFFGHLGFLSVIGNEV